MDVHNHIETFLGTLGDGVTVSPGPLQDLLFECWAAYKDTPAQGLVEQWLGLTIERSMFSVDEVTGLLAEIRLLGDVPVTV